MDRALEQSAEMAGQPAFADESQVIHGGKGFGVFVAEAGDAHHELLGIEPQTFAQRQVTVDVLAKFAALAFDADWQLAVDQHEDIEFAGVAVGQREVQPARARKAATVLLGV